MNPSNSAPVAGPKLGLFGRTKLGVKLTLFNLLIGAAVLALASIIAYTLSLRALRQERTTQLRSLRNMLTREVNDYFQRTRYQVALQADSQTAETALADFTAARKSLLDELKRNGLTVDDALLGEMRETNRAYYERTLGKPLSVVRGRPPEDLRRWMPEDAAGTILQYIYTVQNPAPTGSKAQKNSSDDILLNEKIDLKFRDAFARTSYAWAMNKYQAYFRTLASRFGFDDIYLADPAGNIVYSLSKELDFAGNLRTGPERDAGLGHAFLGAWYASINKEAAVESKVVTTDFGDYDIAYDNAVVFMGAPVLDGVSRRAGAMLFRLSNDTINSLFSFNGHPESAGLGETGIAYMVGPDLLIRNEYRQIDDLPAERKKPHFNRAGIRDGYTSVMKTKLNNPVTERIFAASGANAGKGEMIYTNTRGVDVLGAYGPLSVPGLDAGLVCNISTNEAFAAAYRLRNLILGAGGVILLLLALLSLYFGRKLSRPINDLAEAAAIIATGNNDVRAAVTTGDEVGVAATEFNKMVEARIVAQAQAEAENQRLQNDIREMLMVVSDAADGDMTVRAKVTEGALGNVADAFNLMIENIGELLQAVQNAATRVNTAALEMQGSAEKLATGASEQAGHIGYTTSAMKQMSENLHIVSLNADTANEAADKAKQAADAGDAAVKEVIEGMERIRLAVQSGAKKIKRLGERSMEISTILGTIQAISAQTDMLALNASIEAARAGEEGRGFTIVAEEVRKLSERTANATREIEKLIASIQTDTGEAVVSMESQTAEVERESAVVAGAGRELESIRHAITESAIMIGAMNAASKEQVTGASHVVEAMNFVQAIAEQAQSGSAQTKSASSELATLAGRLTRSVGKFKVADTSEPAINLAEHTAVGVNLHSLVQHQPAAGAAGKEEPLVAAADRGNHGNGHKNGNGHTNRVAELVAAGPAATAAESLPTRG